MRPILLPSEAAAIDRECERLGVSVDALMEAAGTAVATSAVAVAGGAYGRRAVVVCGKGNNGGDGLVAARHLERAGMGVTVMLMEDPSAFAGAARTNFERYERSGGRWRPASPAALRRELTRCDVVVDAIFGTGFRGKPEGVHASAIEALAQGGVPLVAVDVPSGVEGESGLVRGAVARAAVTVTFGALKPGVVFPPGSALAGRVRVADIGIPAGLVRSDLSLVEASDVAAWVPARAADAHKRSTGVALVIAGSRDMTGAAVLASTAAYRAGAGLVTLAAPAAVIAVAQERLVEATFLPLPETREGSVDASAWAPIEERLRAVDAVAIGPGLGRHPSTADLVRRVVAESPVPVVLDADGLNAFAGDAGPLAERASAAVLTPHAGEFARLTGLSTSEIAADRLGQVRKAAAAWRCVVLLKGPRTLVVDAPGTARVNPTGGPALATGGTGDVLTGTIAALAARGVAPFDAAAAGAFLHGAAGDLAAEMEGEGTIASDVASLLPDAVASLPGRAGSGAP